MDLRKNHTFIEIQKYNNCFSSLVWRVERETRSVNRLKDCSRLLIENTTALVHPKTGLFGLVRVDKFFFRFCLDQQ